MTDERSPEAGLWDEDDDQEDNEQTQVARNPLLVGPPADKPASQAETAPALPPAASLQGAPSAHAATPAPVEAAGEPRRSLSSFGTPKVGKKSSLLERLTEAGTIDEVMAIDEVSRNSQLPTSAATSPADRLGLDRPFADLSEISNGIPHAVLESLVPAAPEREERKSSMPPPALTEMQPTPVARVPTVRRVLEPVREITAVRDPRREPDDDFEPSRPSSERLSDADLQFVSETRDVSFVSALSQDPDVDEPPVVARFKRPPDLPRNQPTIPPVASGPSLTAAPDSLTPPATPIAMSAAPNPPPLPSMMVAGAQAPARSDSTPTERMPLPLPLPRPANHSTAPTSAPKTDRPQERRSAMPGMLVAAAVLLGVGLAGLSRYRNAESQAEPVAVAAPSAVLPEVAAPAPVAPVETPKSEPAPAVVEKPAIEATVAPAAEGQSAEEAAAAHAARQEERDRRRKEREAAAAQAPAAAPAGEGAPVAGAAAPAAEAKPASAPTDGAASQPTRDQVVAAMNAVLPRLQECVGDKHGQANVTITVRAAGFVSYAIVAGTFVGTPEGSCIARVVKEAQFPPFGEPFIRITYPYQL